MNQFRELFGCDKEAFKKYVENVVAYNAELEKVFIAIINEIKNRSLGKQINKVFAGRVMEVFPKDSVVVSVDSAGMWDNNKKICVSIHNKKFDGMKCKIENELLRYVSFRNKADYYRESNVTSDNRFTEASIAEIVSVINVNRKRVARLEDALKNMDSQLSTIENAIKTFVETMETVSPVFVDISNISQVVYSSCIPNLKSFKYDKYDNDLCKNVELYTA